jgi:hypothetical protein
MPIKQNARIAANKLKTLELISIQILFYFIVHFTKIIRLVFTFNCLTVNFIIVFTFFSIFYFLHFILRR